jgi:hypothetical protein
MRPKAGACEHYTSHAVSKIVPYPTFGAVAAATPVLPARKWYVELTSLDADDAPRISVEPKR